MSRPEEISATESQSPYPQAHGMTDRPASAENLPGSPKGPAPEPFKTGKAVRIVQCIAGTALILATGFVILNDNGDELKPLSPQPPTPVATETARPAEPPPAAATPPPPQKNRLPGSIALNSRDLTYATTHPGWQRYENDSMEFRVLSKNDTIKAIQVISKQDQAIPLNFLTSFLAEMTGSGAFQVQSGEEKDGYVIEKGTGSDNTRIILYRKKTAGDIKAFVVASP